MKHPNLNFAQLEHVLMEHAKLYNLNDVEIIYDESSKIAVSSNSVVVKVTIAGTKDDVRQEIHMAAKLLTLEEWRRNILPIEKTHSREVFTYTAVLPRFVTFEQKREITDIFPVPELVSASTDKNKEILIMKNVSKQGFMPSAIGNILDYDHSALALKRIAHFHAISFCFKSLHPDEFEVFAINLDDILFNNKWQKFETFRLIRGSIKFAFEHLSLPKAVVDVLKAVKKMFGVRFLYHIDGRNDEHAVVSHGDLWAPNFMFTYEDKKPTNVMLLDWQIARYASPILDLYFFLFTAACDDLRDERFEDLLQIYYQALRHHIEEFKCDPDKLFPESAFRAGLKKYAHVALMTALVMLPLFTMDEKSKPMKRFEDILNDEKSFSFAPKVPTALYIRRVNSMIRDLMRHELLQPLEI